jgi:hydroxymethylpyrimidine/phosphomethylpyrimidine kinase
MSRKVKRPVALTIAGSDSGGGAGVQADLKTFAALGVHGTSVITCLTAQNPRRVLAIEPCSRQMVRQQMEAVFEALRPAAIKTGMLFSTEIIRAVAAFLRRKQTIPLVVDPVMIATSGAALLKPAAIAMLRERLLPLATLVTPNLDETAVLAGYPIASVDDMRSAARDLRARFGCASLIKGGHLHGCREAVDVFYDGRTELLLRAPFVRGVSTHGTGCTFAAAIAAALALGHDLPRAVAIGKRYVTAAIRRSYRMGKHSALGHFAPVR